MFELHSRTELSRPQAGRANKQNVRLLIALSLLVIALAVVLVKDRDFWFGSDQAQESDAGAQIVAPTDSSAALAKAAQAPVANEKNHVGAKTFTHTAAAPAPSQEAASQVPPVVATNRVVLAPLDVEVVAGDKHHTVHPGSNAAKVEILGDSNRASAVTASMANLPASAAERERLSSVSAADLRQTVDATAYPLLGLHSRVQGSVVFQAVVGADGTIEDLRVLSGPAILVTAAQQAVRQWHFKPVLQNGQAVETKTRITVNFSIRVSDNPATAS